MLFPISAPKQVADGSSSLPRARVLIVDDEKDLLLLLQDILECRDFEVRVADSAAEGLAAVQDFAATVALVDIRLGTEDGIDHILRLKETLPNLKCLVMTAHADTDSALRALDCGAYGFLRKPLNTEELLVTLERCCEGVDLETRERESRQRERAILDASFDAIVSVGPDGNVQFASESLKSVFDWTPGDLEGRSAAHLFLEADSSHVYQYLESLAARVQLPESCHPTAIVARRRDGALFPCEVAVSHTARELGQEPLLVAAFRDKTQQERSRLENESLTAQLVQAQKMEAVGQLAGGMAHDFNNILTVIQANAEQLGWDLSQRRQLDSDADMALVDIKDAVHRASTLTRQLLTFSREYPAELESFDLNDAVARLERMFRITLTERIQLLYHLDSLPRNVYADRSQLEQVLMNLVLNARDAMPRGGTISIRTRVGCLSPPEGFYEVVVEDTGTGMDAATLSRVFEPFFTTKAPGQGSGLGLSTAYGIVKNLGGNLYASSTPGDGSSFAVALPVTEAGQSQQRSSAEVVSSPGGTETILVCEDDDSVRALAARVLEDVGYQVLRASSSGEALQVVEQHEGVLPLLVTDVLLPDGNGLQLSEALVRSRPAVRTLFMSGYTSGILESRGSTSRLEFLAKPFSAVDLLRRVRQVLDSSV